MAENRQIIHVDMDAFYSSVEQLDNPDPIGKAVISAMPMSEAIRLCPDAIVLPVRMKRYAEFSQQIHTIFQQFTPQIEPIFFD